MKTLPSSLPEPLAAFRRVRLAATCCAALFLYALYFGAIGVLLPSLGAAFRLGPAVAGQLFPADFAGFILGVLLCGYLSDRWGRKTVLLLSIAAYALGLALFGIAPTFGLALLASALVGSGSGAMETVASALASDLYPEKRAFIINTIQIAFGAGAALGPALAHRLLLAATGWRTLYLGLAAATIGLFLVVALQPLPRSERHAETLDWGVLRAVLRQPAFVMLCLAQALYVGAETGFFSWMPTYFLRRLPGGGVWAGTVVTLFWIAMTVGRIATGALIGRLPVLRLNLLLALGGVVGAALALVWTQPWVVLCFVVWTGLCFSGIFGLILAEAGERYPHVTGTVFGGVVATSGLGGAVVPWAVGVLADTSFGWRGALLLIPLCVFGIAAITLRLQRTENS